MPPRDSIAGESLDHFVDRFRFPEGFLESFLPGSPATLSDAENLTRRRLLTAIPGLTLIGAGVSCGDDDDDATPTADATVDATVDATGETAVANTPTAAATATPAKRTVDTIWGPVEVPSAPQRVVSYSFVATAALLDIGITPVGCITSNVDFLPEYADVLKGIPIVEPAPGQPDFELIANLQPDLILAADWLDESKRTVQYETFKGIAPTAIVEWQQAAGNWPDQAEKFAGAVGRANELAALKQQYTARAAAIRAANAASLEKYTWDLVTGGAAQFFIYGPNSSHGKVLADAGLRFGAAANVATGFEQVTAEQMSRLADTGVLAFDGRAAAKANNQAMQDLAVFKSLPAVQAGRVMELPWFFPSSYKVALALLDVFDERLGQLS